MSASQCSNTIHLQYTELVNAYAEALHNTLRNFKPVPDFLDTWVPDDQLNMSLIGIIEAAAESNQLEISIALSRDQVLELDCDNLRKETEKLGVLTLTENGNVVFRFKKGGELNIGSLYQKNLNLLSSRVVHEGRFERIEPTQTQYVSQVGGTQESTVQLSCLINTENKIVAAKHSGGSGTLRVLMDQFCAEIIGLPVQEASEHGVLRLEYRLRDKNLSRNIPGILTAKNTDPVFQVPLQLIRDIFSQFRKATNYELVRNFYVDSVQPSFAQLATEEKIEKVQARIREICAELGLQSDIEVVDFKPDARAVLSFRQDANLANVGQLLLKIEALLQERLEPRLELILESVEDANKRKGRSARKACSTSTTEASV